MFYTLPYSKGTALSPNNRNLVLFLEPTDLKEAISIKILTSESMPTFLIFGQRRTGKIFLLNFFPQLLGSRFDMVSMDLESISGVKTPVILLQALRDKIIDKLKISEKGAWQAFEDWLEAWSEFESFLRSITFKKERKLILAFDEYEQLHHILEREPEIRGSFLSRMRAFSQSQSKNPIEMPDVEYVLWHQIVKKSEQPFSFFWDEFCELESMRAVVKAIASH